MIVPTISPIKRPYGYAIRRGVVVVWDADRDERIFNVIDGMAPRHRDQLLAAHECKAGLYLVWIGNPPTIYEELGYVEVPDDWDSWNIVESRAIVAEVRR